MANLKVILFFTAIIALYMSMNGVVVSMPIEKNDNVDEIVMKIEKLNEQFPAQEVITTEGYLDVDGDTTTSSDDSVEVDDNAKLKKKTQRNYPIYYVNTKVNGKFGKSVRAFTSDEFIELYPNTN